MVRTLGLPVIYRFFKKTCVSVNRSHIPWVEKYLLCHDQDTSDYMGSTASLGSFMDDDDSLGATNPHFSK